jgi:CRP-like cAMP-binding protein
MEISSAACRNRLLAALPHAELNQLYSTGERVRLPAGSVLCHSGEEIRYVYFPEQGLIALVATMMDGATVETGLVGREGMTGVPVLLGATSAPYRAIVQVAGEAWRLRAETFKEELQRHAVLQHRLLLYTQALMTLMSQMAACNCLHTVEERLCGLLLMIHDRIESGTFSLTHEALAEMLGARRAGITVAAGKLRDAGVINYVRGHVHITNRHMLELSACECYQTIRGEFDRLVAPGAPEPALAYSPLLHSGSLSAGMNHGRESISLTR